MLNLHSRKWVSVETYGEIILISDSEFLSDGFQKSLAFFWASLSSQENFEYC